MTPKGQLVTVFHHCLAGESARARVLAQWMKEPDRSFGAWAARACGLGAG
jgi:hypothetical protein